MHFQKRPTTAMKANPKVNPAPPPPMPNVFVTPPEEDDAPAWCCFDATNPSHPQVMDREWRQPQFDDEDNRFYYSAVESHTERGAAGPTEMKTSIVDAAIGKRSFVVVEGDDGDDDIDLETISDYGHELEEAREPMSRDVANDSDVVEVVKVRRRTGEYQEGGDRPVVRQPAKAKSLKSRASSAFKTLTGSLRSKRRDTTSSGSSSRSSRDRQSVDQPQVAASKSQRRSSGILSQLFKSTSFDVDVPRSSIAQLDIASASSPSHQDQLRLSASSPTPSTASRMSSRFSRLSLRGLFSFNEPESTALPIPAPILPLLASASSSTTSPAWPETPTSAEFEVSSPLPSIVDSMFDQAHDLDLGIGLGLTINPIKANSNSNLASASAPSPPTTPRKSTTSSIFTSSSISTSPTRRSTSSTIGSVWGLITPKLQRSPIPAAAAAIGSPRSSFISMGVLNEDADPDSDPLEDGDTSLEIRLDSLHFDSISFDVDRFGLP